MNRLGGAAVIIGAILLFVGNALHPSFTAFDPSISPADVSAYASAALGNAWVAIHVDLDLGLVVLAFGLITLYGLLKQRGEVTYSVAGLYCLLLGTGVYVVDVTIHGLISPVLARDYLAATGAAQANLGVLFRYNIFLDLVLVPPWVLLLFASVGFFGASMLRANLFNRALAAIGIVLGLVMMVGYPLGLLGTYVVLSSLWPPIAAVTLLWIIAIGIFMVRAKA